MARGRIISKSISTSRKVAKLSEFGALLYTWIIPHCDDYGRMDGDAHMVKAVAVPLRIKSIADVEKELAEMDKVGLIKRYEMAGSMYLEIINFSDFQTFRTDRKRMALFPPPLKVGQRYDVGTTNDVPVGENSLLSEVKLSEVKLSNTPYSPPKGTVAKKSKNQKLEKYTPEFELFWEIYPMKVKKYRVFQSWEKLTADERAIAIQAIKRQLLYAHFRGSDGKDYIPHATTWVNGRRWEDEVKEELPKAQNINTDLA